MNSFNTKLDNQNKAMNELKKANTNNNEIKNMNSSEAIAMKTNVETQTTMQSDDKSIQNNIPRCNNNIPYNNAEVSLKNQYDILASEPERRKSYANMAMKPHTHTKHNEGNNEFTKVSYKKKNSPVFGTKQATNKSIAGQRTIRTFNLFIGGVNKEVTPDELGAYMKEELNIETTNIEVNKQNEFNQSFKVTINSTDKNIVFRPDAWENNIVIKPFRERRNDTEYGYKSRYIRRQDDIDNNFENKDLRRLSSPWL